jgi:hypothetical protein
MGVRPALAAVNQLDQSLWDAALLAKGNDGTLAALLLDHF